MHSLIGQTPVASIVSNPRLPDNPIIACNDAFCALTGYAASEVIGRNCRFLSGAGPQPWLSHVIGNGVEQHRPVLFEVINYKRDGSPFRNAVLVAPVYDDVDQLLYFIGSQVEIGANEPGLSLERQARAGKLVATLSPRQHEVLRGMAAGLRNKQIAAELGLAEKTVKMHRAIMMQKLAMPSTADLIRLAVEAGL